MRDAIYLAAFGTRDARGGVIARRDPKIATVSTFACEWDAPKLVSRRLSVLNGILTSIFGLAQGTQKPTGTAGVSISPAEHNRRQSSLFSTLRRRSAREEAREAAAAEPSALRDRPPRVDGRQRVPRGAATHAVQAGSCEESTFGGACGSTQLAAEKLNYFLPQAVPLPTPLTRNNISTEASKNLRVDRPVESRLEQPAGLEQPGASGAPHAHNLRDELRLSEEADWDEDNVVLAV